jgi:hypothetical protein
MICTIFVEVLQITGFTMIELVADWSVENMNPYMTPKRRLLNISVSPEQIQQKSNFN